MLDLKSTLAYWKEYLSKTPNETIARIVNWTEKVTYIDDLHYYIKSPYFKGEVINTEKKLKKLRNKMRKIEEFAFDTETSNLRVQYPGEVEVVGISISWGYNNTYYIPIGHLVNDDEDQLPIELVSKYLREIFARKDVRIIGHNLKFDMHVLANEGMLIETDDLFDTMVAYFHLDENNEKDLKSIVKRYYHYQMTEYDETVLMVPSHVKKEFGYKGNQKVPISLVDMLFVTPYAMDDAYWTWKVYCDVQDAMEDEGCEWFFYEKHMPFLRVLFNMERRGVKVDVKRLEKMQKMAEKDLQELEYRIKEIAGIDFNINSDQHLQELLFGYEKKLPIYEEIKIYETDANGNPVYYKSGKNKGQQKFKIKKNKEKIVGWRDAFNEHIVANSFKFPVVDTTESGAPSTNAKALESLLEKTYKRDKRKQEGQEMIRLILRYNILAKLKGTYMDGMLKQVYSDGKIHCSYNIVGTQSARLSSSEPNLQNLPRPLEEVLEPDPKRYETKEKYQEALARYKEEKAEYDFWSRYEIRDVFIPDTPNDVIIVLDYNNLEARLQAHYSQDPLLIEMFKNKYDIHGYTGVKIFNLECHPNECKKLYPEARQLGKSIRFALQYGGTEFAVSRNSGISKEEAREKLDQYYNTFKGEAEYKRRQIKFAHENGFVYSLLKRKRHLIGINSPDYREKSYYERLALNYPNQSGAADIIISAQILIENDKRLKELGAKQVMQTHDELAIITSKESAEEVMKIAKYHMENCLNEPLKNVDLIAEGNYSEVSYARAK